MTAHTFDDVLTAARQLPPAERARLAQMVLQELALAAEPGGWSWAQMDAFITDFHATYPTVDPAAQVMADRRTREGIGDAHD